MERIEPRRTLYVATVLAMLVASVLPVAAASPAGASVTTVGKDLLRTGWYPDQAALTPSLVSGGTFGQMFDTTVDGQVYAQPVVANGTLLVATERNNVYGLDPTTGAVQWSRNLGTPWDPSDIGCGDLTPDIGITSTPVVDAATNTAYLVAKTYASGTSGPGAWWAHALDLSTGAERPGFPVRIQGSASNDPSRSFNATTQLQRAGLLLMDGVVYAGFGSHCDVSPWTGWVVGIATTGSVTTMWTSMAGSTDDGAGIWQAGGGPVSDRDGDLIVATGNGGAPTTPTAGSQPPGACGECIERLRVQPDGSLRAVDFFAPYDAPQLDSWDADVASGAPMELPSPYFGTTQYPHLMVQVGKEGYVYLLNADSLGGFRQGPSGGDQVVGRIGPYGGVWSKPAVWPGDGGYVYIPTASGGNSASGSTGYLRAYKYGLDGTGKPTLNLVATSTDAFGFGSSAPVVTSDGTTSGSALVWVVWSPGGSGQGAQLRAYDAVPVGGHFNLRFSAPVGTASKFANPAVDGNRVYVGTRDGHVLSFGSPVTQPLSGSPIAFPTTTLGQSSVQTATLTATADLSVTAVSASNGAFVPGTPSPPLPATLHTGDTISVPVTFTPTAVGLAAGNLSVTTSIGTVTVGVSGTGQSATAELTATPPAISFGGVPLGDPPAVGGATFTNTGAQPLTITGVTLPSAPFSVTGAPAVGAQLAPGASLAVTASFAPTTAGLFTDALVVASTAGTVTVPMSGTASVPPRLVITPLTNDYGLVPVGGSVTRSFTVENAGGTQLTITKSKPPASAVGFQALTTLNEGTTIQPGEKLVETVAFTPSSAGTASDAWLLTGNDSTGPQTVTFQATAVTNTALPDPTAGGWQLNGSATVSGSSLQLTAAGVNDVAGSAFWPDAVSSTTLHASFDATLSGGDGADGLTLTLADASTTSPAAIGESGGGLGYSDISGIAIALDTYQNGNDPSSNFVGIATGADSPGSDTLVWAATSTDVPDLRSATRHVDVSVAGGHVIVAVDGTQVLDQAMTLPPKVLVGFTGANGGLTDTHAVSNVSISVGTPPGIVPSIVHVPEGNSGTKVVHVPVTLTAPSGLPVSATYTAVPFTAHAPSDFQATTGTVTFAPGTTTTSFDLVVNGDTTYENDEFLFVTLTDVSNATVTGGFYGLGVVFLTNDDPPPKYVPGVVTVTRTAQAQQITVPVTLSAASGVPVTMDWTTVDGTAHQPADYSAASGSLTFAPGQTSKTITLTISPSTGPQPTQGFFLVFSNVSGATPGGFYGLGVVFEQSP